MHLTRIMMIGGFLAAGKTTTIARLARIYQDRGRRVAIITNDHAGDLVDTCNLRSQGLQVGEIAGGCFCGNMESFMASVNGFGSVSPDIILVEPIGSCIDLAATVIRPLRQQNMGRFDIAPFCVLVKPNHATNSERSSTRWIFTQGGVSFSQAIGGSRSDCDQPSRPAFACRSPRIVGAVSRTFSQCPHAANFVSVGPGIRRTRGIARSARRVRQPRH